MTYEEAAGIMRQLISQAIVLGRASGKPTLERIRIEAIYKAVEALEKQATQKWISVDDRLPEFSTSVLARCFYHGKLKTLVCHTSKENFGEWYTDEVCQWVKVTHWMPLPPELQKGE